MQFGLNNLLDGQISFKSIATRQTSMEFFT